MNRTNLYITTYIITLLFFIAFNSNPIADTLVFLVFLLSSLLYIFAIESLPKTKLMRIPEVFKYQKERTNTFGVYMSIVLAIASFIFGYLTINFKVRAGVVVLILWPLIIFIAIKVAQIVAERDTNEILKHFIRSNLSAPSQETDKIIEMIIELDKNGDMPIKELEKGILQRENTNTSIPLLHETILLFKKFKNSNHTALPEEIEEINQY